MKYYLLLALVFSLSAQAELSADVSTPPSYAPTAGKDYKSCLQDYKRDHPQGEVISITPSGPLFKFLSGCTANPALVSSEHSRNKALALDSLKTLTADVGADQMLCVVYYRDVRRDMIVPEKFFVSRTDPVATAKGIAQNLGTICNSKDKIFLSLMTDWKGD